MKVKIISVGKIKKKWIASGVEDYVKRFSPEIIELKDSNSEKEGLIIVDKIKSSDYVVALSEEGKSFGSVEFAGLIKKCENDSVESICFIIGGPDGLTKNVKDRSNLLMSLSDMTFTHEMARLFLVEQIYRAISINNGKKYHRV